MSSFPGAFLRHLMPALCSAISSSSSSASMSDTRFFCLRIMSDCLALYLTSTDLQQGLGGVGAQVSAGHNCWRGDRGACTHATPPVLCNTPT